MNKNILLFPFMVILFLNSNAMNNNHDFLFEEKKESVGVWDMPKEIEKQFGKNFYEMKFEGAIAEGPIEGVYTFYYQVKETENTSYKNIAFEYNSKTKVIELKERKNKK